jgi:hypothetical protein
MLVFDGVAAGDTVFSGFTCPAGGVNQQAGELLGFLWGQLQQEWVDLVGNFQPFFGWEDGAVNAAMVHVDAHNFVGEKFKAADPRGLLVELTLKRETLGFIHKKVPPFSFQKRPDRAILLQGDRRASA